MASGFAAASFAPRLGELAAPASAAAELAPTAPPAAAPAEAELVALGLAGAFSTESDFEGFEGFALLDSAELVVVDGLASAGAPGVFGDAGATGSTLSTMRTPLGFLADELRCSLALMSASVGRLKEVVGWSDGLEGSPTGFAPDTGEADELAPDAESEDGLYAGTPNSSSKSDALSG